MSSSCDPSSTIFHFSKTIIRSGLAIVDKRCKAMTIEVRFSINVSEILINASDFRSSVEVALFISQNRRHLRIALAIATVVAVRQIIYSAPPNHCVKNRLANDKIVMPGFWRLLYRRRLRTSDRKRCFRTSGGIAMVLRHGLILARKLAWVTSKYGPSMVIFPSHVGEGISRLGERSFSRTARSDQTYFFAWFNIQRKSWNRSVPFDLGRAWLFFIHGNFAACKLLAKSLLSINVVGACKISTISFALPIIRL